MNHPQTVDYIAECAIIEISRIQRKVWNMARRLATDAKIVLEKAGYEVWKVGYKKTNTLRLEISNSHNMGISTLIIEGGTVDNDEVVKLLNARGFNEFGYKR